MVLSYEKEMTIKRIKKLLPEGLTVGKLKSQLPIGGKEVKHTLWDMGNIDSSVSISRINKIIKELKKEYKGIKNFRIKVEAPEIYYESDVSLAEISVAGDRPETKKEYLTRLEGQLLMHREYCFKYHKTKCVHGWKISKSL